MSLPDMYVSAGLCINMRKALSHGAKKILKVLQQYDEVKLSTHAKFQILPQGLYLWR
ncbi:hypothetical protein PHLCEN_2v12926 [Hermanssonia centrifuga]|uniref:Uncharacterized protein n=1 Tax=Hermanssonia centrifuga TaxID=98765 RepID=A0A2R6NFM6_9APHY|nr:hypothetical protein PHLCEN_2v12926 [Hermanssonia centrifuga]